MTQLVDELLLLNIDSDQINPESLFVSTLRSMANGIRYTALRWRWVRALEDIELLQSGADKVVINTHANLNPEFIDKAALRFGSQCNSLNRLQVLYRYA